jgi:hypothetical protein
MFSYWLVIWFILYYLKFIKSSPLLILLFAYIGTICTTFYYIDNNISKYNLIKFLIINNIIKLIPILLIINFPIIITKDDLNMTFFLIIIYVLIMINLNKNPYVHYKNAINSYLNNTHKTYLSEMYDNYYDKYLQKN